jgi:hypothetical protein
MRLANLAKSISSKNAGNFHLTFDIVFDDPEAYRRVRDSAALSPKRVAALYSVPEETVENVVHFDAGNAIKITLRRARPSGSPGETDVFGAQQYPPLLEVDVP